MKRYKTLKELGSGYEPFPFELAREIIYNIHLVERSFPRENLSCVLVLEHDETMETVYKEYPYLDSIIPEIDEVYACENGEKFQMLVYIISNGDSNIAVFRRLT